MVSHCQLLLLQRHYAPLAVPGHCGLQHGRSLVTVVAVVVLLAFMIVVPMTIIMPLGFPLLWLLFLLLLLLLQMHTSWRCSQGCAASKRVNKSAELHTLQPQ